MNAAFQTWLSDQIETLKSQNLYKIPKILETPAGGRVRMNGKEVVGGLAVNELDKFADIARRHCSSSQ